MIVKAGGFMIIGLTGGIASGKSTVSSILQTLGANIIDADLVARDIVKRGEKAYNEIVQHFGKEILLENGEINRKKLGSIVFSDKEELKILESITHQEIFMRIEEEIGYLKSNNVKVIIIDAAILIESSLYTICDTIWLVVVDNKVQIDRLMKRDNLTYDEALNRIRSQYTNEEKEVFADIIIDNDKSMNELKKEIELLWGRLAYQRGEIVEKEE